MLKQRHATQAADVSAPRGALLFDLDETLIDRRSGLLRFASTLWREGMTQAATEDVFLADFIALDNNGRTARREFFQQLCVRHLPATDPALVLERFLATAWQAPPLFADAVDTLRTLEAHGWRVGIVSNGSTRTQRDKILRSALAPWAERSVISEEFGSKKPAAAIYLHALEKLGVSPEQAWFVGDCPINDVCGASSAGLKAIWLERHTPWPEACERMYAARVTQLSGVLDVVA